MGIVLKNEAQIDIIRQACQIAAETHQILEKMIAPGISTGELDRVAAEFIFGKGATPSFKGYKGYPAAICVSVNNEVIHGIPGLRRLKQGDIVSIDIGAYYKGFHGDCARTYPVGNISAEARDLIDRTRESFFKGIEFARPGMHLHQISEAIQKHVEAHGLSVVRDFVGHGIGKILHEEPQIPHYKPKGRGPLLQKGMTLCIEPMINLGTYEVEVLDDGWTVVTKDDRCSAHYENTILITDSDPEILTKAAGLL